MMSVSPVAFGDGKASRCAGLRQALVAEGACHHALPGHAKWRGRPCLHCGFTLQPRPSPPLPPGHPASAPAVCLTSPPPLPPNPPCLTTPLMPCLLPGHPAPAPCPQVVVCICPAVPAKVVPVVPKKVPVPVFPVKKPNVVVVNRPVTPVVVTPPVGDSSVSVCGLLRCCWLGRGRGNAAAVQWQYALHAHATCSSDQWQRRVVCLAPPPHPDAAGGQAGCGGARRRHRRRHIHR